MFLECFRPNVSGSRTLRFFLPIIAGIGIAIALILTEHLLRYLHFPFPLDDGEGFCLNQAAQIALGRPLYPPLGNSPYMVTNYPPVYLLLLSIFTDPENLRFLPGRLLSAISTVVLCVAAAGCVRAATGDRRAAWISALLVAASPVIYFWGALHRVDVLASALGMVGLWIAMSSRGRRVLWALPFVLAALFTRQSSIEAAIAIGIALFLNLGEDEKGREKPIIRSITFFAAWVVGIVLIIALLQAWTGGEFWNHTVIYTRTKFYPARIWSALEWILPTHAIVIILALFALPRAIADKRRRMLGLFFLASVATAVLAGKVGSDLNYFLNLIVAAACLGGCFAHDILRASITTDRPPGWTVLALLLIPAALIQSGLIEGDRSLSFTPLPADYRNGRQIVETLTNAQGPILSEDEGFCLLSGHEVIFNPFIMSELSREGTWDETPFVDAIRSRSFDIIMLRFDVNDPTHDDRPGAGGYAGWDRFTPGMEEAIKMSYEIDPAAGPIFMRRWWFIYRPRETEVDVPSDAAPARNLLE